MVDTAPPWLESMRADLGVEEIPGSAVNPRIIAKARLPGVKFPDVQGLVAYGLLYKSDDEQAWCGAEAGGCLAEVGIMPPFGPKDTDRYFWAASFRQWGVNCSIRVGAIVCFDGHVTMVNRIIGSSQIECIGGNQGSPKGGAVTKSTRNTADVRACRWPDDASLAAAGLSQFSLHAAPDPTAAPFRPEIKLGSSGGFVTEAQTLLGLAATGIFDEATDAAVRAFQVAHGLSMVDGEIGEETWPVLRASKGQPAPVTSAGLSPEAVARIVSIAGSSALASLHWNDRGVAPRGYIKGMAVTFAKVYLDLKAGKSSALAMTVPLGSPEKDALAWYGVARTDSVGFLRALFALLIGLGMRESSGNYSEGRDTSASNTSADTAEAGLFQQSWNSRAASPELAKLLFTVYSSSNVDGFLSIFREGVSAKSTDNYGGGEGAEFQAMCKFKPAFAVECAAVGLRVLRQHWGPINRREAEIRPEADALLLQVQQVVDAIVTKPDPIFIPPDEPGKVMPDPILIPPPQSVDALLAEMNNAIRPVLQKWANSQVGVSVQSPLAKKIEMIRALGATPSAADLAALANEQGSTPASPVAPPTTPTVSPLWANLGTAGTLLSGIAALWAGGAMPDTTALVSAAASTALSFTGIPAPVINAVLGLFKGVKITRTTA